MRIDQYQEKTHEISHSATLAKALFRTQWHLHGYDLCLGYPNLQSVTQILSLLLLGLSQLAVVRVNSGLANL